MPRLDLPVPGCDRPAEFCDIDHTIPFNHADPSAGGLTVPWSLKCLCREQQLWNTLRDNGPLVNLKSIYGRLGRARRRDFADG